MFNVSRDPLGATVHCQECQASLTVDSDHKPTVEKSIATFERRHHCRIVDQTHPSGEKTSGRHHHQH